MSLHKRLKRIFMTRQGRINEAIQKHGAMAVFEAGAAGECEDYAPLQVLGLDIETIANAELISNAAYDRLTVEEKVANYWEASLDQRKRLPEAAILLETDLIPRHSSGSTNTFYRLVRDNVGIASAPPPGDNGKKRVVLL